MAAPNEVWSADFKGHFKTGDGRYCYPLTITDNNSRFLLGCEALSSTRVQEAKPVFTRVFKELGLPQRIRTDNGVPFATNTLAACYESSPRKMPNKLPPLEYPGRFEVRYVSANGGIRWNHQ
jgi:transposase InsO family protein